MKPRTTIILLASVIALATPALAFGAARSELRPSELATGQTAQLLVTIDGTGTPPETVRASGATIRLRGTMSRTSIVNGSRREETVFSYTVVPTRTGTLEIPAIRVKTSAGTVSTEPLRATVSAAPQPPSSPGRSGSRSADDRTTADEPARAFAKLRVPAKSLYVGQAVPIRIHAYFRAGTAATLQGPPKLGSDAFTLSDLSDEPTQREIEIRGERYLMATWTATLSPAKPSAAKLTVELPVEIAYREMRPRQGRSLRDLVGRDPFGDPFADSFFDDPDSFFNNADPFAGFDLDAFADFGQVQRRTLTLRASAGTVTVVEPPAAKRPDQYGGAVGRFELALDPPPGPLRVGEPANVTMRVTGTGNFDRVSIAGLSDSSTFKTYAVKQSFRPDKSNVDGTKTFTQTIVPTRAGGLALPAVSFAYFDPDKRTYRVVETKPVTIDVSPAPGGAEASLDTGIDRGAAVNREEHATSVASLAPRYRDPGFWIVPGGIAIATAFLVGLAWWRRSPWVASLLGERRTGRAVGQALAGVDRAVRSGDVVGFFAAARRAFQIRIGELYGIAPDAVTARDVADKLEDRGSTICTLFELADQVTYAKALTSAEPLEHWRTVVRTELAHLEASS